MSSFFYKFLSNRVRHYFLAVVYTYYPYHSRYRQGAGSACGLRNNAAGAAALRMNIFHKLFAHSCLSYPLPLISISGLIGLYDCACHTYIRTGRDLSLRLKTRGGKFKTKKRPTDHRPVSLYCFCRYIRLITVSSTATTAAAAEAAASTAAAEAATSAAAATTA